MLRTLTVTLTLAGCGVPGATPLGSLGPEEMTAVCEESLEALGLEETNCFSGLTASPESLETCTARLSALVDCSALVSDYQSCTEERVDNPCDGFGGPACAAIRDCLGYE